MSNSVRPHRQQPTRLPWPWDFSGKNTGVGCHFLFQCMKVESESEVAQSCPTLRDPMVCSLPDSSIHEIFQARILEWGAIALCSIFFFTTLILPVHKHDIFLHPFVSSLISFISILYFSVHRSFVSLGKFIPKYFILFIAMVNEIVSLIYYEFSLLLYRKVRDLCILILYPATLLYSLISVQFSRSVVSDSLRPHELQHARPPCPSTTPRVNSDSHPSSQ